MLVEKIILKNKKYSLFVLLISLNNGIRFKLLETGELFVSKENK